MLAWIADTSACHPNVPWTQMFTCRHCFVFNCTAKLEKAALLSILLVFGVSLMDGTSRSHCDHATHGLAGNSA